MGGGGGGGFSWLEMGGGVWGDLEVGGGEGVGVGGERRRNNVWREILVVGIDIKQWKRDR